MQQRHLSLLWREQQAVGFLEGSPQAGLGSPSRFSRAFRCMMSTQIPFVTWPDLGAEPSHSLDVWKYCCRLRNERIVWVGKEL